MFFKATPPHCRACQLPMSASALGTVHRSGTDSPSGPLAAGQHTDPGLLEHGRSGVEGP